LESEVTSKSEVINKGHSGDEQQICQTRHSGKDALPFMCHRFFELRELPRGGGHVARHRGRTVSTNHEKRRGKTRSPRRALCEQGTDLDGGILFDEKYLSVPPFVAWSCPPHHSAPHAVTSGSAVCDLFVAHVITRRRSRWRRG
jgi:hypothetical protein